MRPKVGTEIRTVYCPGRSFFNPDGGFSRRAPSAAKKAVDVGLGHPHLLGKSTGSYASGMESRTEVSHPAQGNTFTLTVQPSGSHFLDSGANHNWPMSRYLQQPLLKAAIKDYQNRSKKTQEEVAKELGTTRGTLLQWLNNKKRHPELKSLQKISALTRVSVMEFIDDPGRDYAGQDLSHESEETRFLAMMIIKGVVTKDLTNEQRTFIIEDIIKTIERVGALPTGGIGPGRQDQAGSESNIQPHSASVGPSRTPRPKR